MDLAARARNRPAVPLPAAGTLPARDRRRASGGIGWARRATTAGPRLSLLLPPVPRRAGASAASGGRLIPRHVACSVGGGEPRGEDDRDSSSPTRADPSDDAKDHAASASISARDHPGGIRKELVNLAVPAIIGQAIDPLAQLLEAAYIGRLAAVGVSVFNIISKLFNIPLLSITTSFVAEDISRHDSSQFSSGGNISSETGERKRLPSISSALLLAAAIGVVESLALILGSGILLNIMGVSHASTMHSPARLFLSVKALGAPAAVVSLAIQGVFRGLKDTKTPLLHSGLGNISAVVLLPFFVYSLNLGLTGAALATIASHFVAAICRLPSLFSFSKRTCVFIILFTVLLAYHFYDLETPGGMLLGRTLSLLITMTLATAMAAPQGTLAMAAHQICLQVWLAVSLLSDALAVSAQTGVFVGVALGLLLFASFGRLAELFSSDPMVLQIVGSGVLMVVGALSSLFLLYAPRVLGLHGVWAGLALFMSLRMAAGFVRSACDICVTTSQIGLESRALVVFTPERSVIQFILSLTLISSSLWGAWGTYGGYTPEHVDVKRWVLQMAR